MNLLNTHNQYRRFALLSAAAAVIALTVFAVQGIVRANSTISLTVTNNSQRSVERLYFAPGDPNNWGPDQLNGSAISPGASITLNNVTCSGSSVRVIAEDRNGCFVYGNASCDGNQTWEITSTATPDCGGN